MDPILEVREDIVSIVAVDCSEVWSDLKMCINSYESYFEVGRVFCSQCSAIGELETVLTPQLNFNEKTCNLDE